MTPTLHWYTAAEFADELGKHHATILRWCNNGFIISLGHRVVRDESGYWHIGVREDLHFPSKYSFSQSPQPTHH